MSRPQTKGPPVAVRLTLMAMERAQARADDAGLPLRRWVEATLERALLPSEKADVADAKGRHPTTKRVQSATEAEDPDVARLTTLRDSLTGVVPPDDPPGCEHPRSDVRAGGIRVCRDCGAIKGIGGLWRVP